jgi:hypothetical protein
LPRERGFRIAEATSAASSAGSAFAERVAAPRLDARARLPLTRAPDARTHAALATATARDCIEACPEK